MTFSIAARCNRTHELGVAVTTAWFAVGSISFLVRPGLGAVTCQAIPSPQLGESCLAALASGMLPEEAIPNGLLSDPLASYRQVGLVDSSGKTAGYTGNDCDPYCGHIIANDYVIAGNVLHSARVLDAIEESWLHSSNRNIPLAERLLSALEAGQGEGGDRRGSQSSALFVGNEKPLLNVDLRVDDSPTPLAELRRLLKLYREKYEPIYQQF